MSTVGLNNNTDPAWWRHNASAKEIRNQLALRGVDKDLWVWKDREHNLALLIKTIKQQGG